MTFGNFILRLRQRLQDLRTSSGTVISTITDNGIRWSANNLIEIANGAITESVRLINQYSDSTIMRSLGQGFFEAFNTGVVFANGMATVPNGMLVVTAVQDRDIVASGYRDFVYMPPDIYDEVVADRSKPRSDMWVYTVRYSMVLAARKIQAQKGDILADGNLTVVGIYNKSDYSSGDSSITIFLEGIDDFLLDVAERECRDREHNWDRSQILDARIALKLGMSRSQNG